MTSHISDVVINSQHAPTARANLLSGQRRADRILLSLRILVAATAFALPTLSSAQRSRTFGRKWVETHPFLIAGWASALTDIELFKGSGLNAVMSGSGGPILQAAKHSIPWIYLANYSANEDAGWKNNVQRQLAKPNNMGWGWMMEDEPRAIQFPELATFADWLKDPANRASNMLVSASLWDSTLQPRPALYWGNTSRPNYTYEQYLYDWVSRVRPDVLSYSAYPYLGNYAKYPATGVAPENIETHLNTLMRVRKLALNHDIPYQVWVRSEKYRRGTGDSELRLQLFAALTTGHKGIYYFQYEHRNSRAYLVNYGDLADPTDDTPNELYPIAAAANAEVAKLGESLRFLRSTGVYFIHNGTHSRRPSRIPEYASGVQQKQMTEVRITSAASRFTDGIIGYFEDYYGDEYFMLMNLNFDTNDGAQDTLEFELQFDPTVSSLLRLNRHTGQDEVIPLTRQHLRVTLPGGTGDLFKYRTGRSFMRQPGRNRSAREQLFADDFEGYIGRNTGLFIQRFDTDPNYHTSGWQAFAPTGTDAADSLTIIARGGGAGAPGGYGDSQGLANVGGGNSHGHAARLSKPIANTTIELTVRLNMAAATTPSYIYLGSDFLAGGALARDDKIWLEFFNDGHDRLAGRARLEYAVDGVGMGATFNLWQWENVGWAEVKLEVKVGADGFPVAIRVLHRKTPGAGKWKTGAELSTGNLAIQLTHLAVQPGFYATLDDLRVHRVISASQNQPQ